MPVYIDQNLENAKRQYNSPLKDIDIITNMNTGFRGHKNLFRSSGVRINNLDTWIRTLSERGGVLAERPLATYTLPGSHDAMTYAFGGCLRSIAKGATVTQRLDLTSQFNRGIRYFDIRLSTSRGKLCGFHGIINLTNYDAEAALANLFRISVQKKEPIVIKFDYKNGAFPIVNRLARMFSAHILPTADYWKVGVGESIRQGKVLCLFHKVNTKKHEKKFGDTSDVFGSYSKHKAGGFSNTHNMKTHSEYLSKMVDESYSPKEEKLKVMSLNVPCIPTKKRHTAAYLANLALLTAPQNLYKAGQVACRIPSKDRWIGFYKSVNLKNINQSFVHSLTQYVDNWYNNSEVINYQERLRHGDKITEKIAGAVGMDFIEGKGKLILGLIELNNRDF